MRTPNLFDTKNENPLFNLLSKIFCRDKELFYSFILSKFKIKNLSIILIFLTIFDILNIFLIGSIHYEDYKNRKLKFILFNNNLSNFSKEIKDPRIFLRNSLPLNIYKEKIKNKNLIPKNRFLLNQINPTFIEKDKNESLKLANQTFVVNKDNFSLQNDKNSNENYMFDKMKILIVSIILLIIKLTIILISYMKFLLKLRKYNNKKNKLNKYRIKSVNESNDLLFPNVSSNGFELKNDKIINNNNNDFEYSNELKRKFLNSKINLLYCVSFLNIFDIFF